MRAIEQGRYLARAANTGITGFVDPYGRVLQKTEIFERAILVGDVRLLEGRTIYGRIGDLFAYICAALTARSRWLLRLEAFVAIALDDLTRRYQDLVKRAADLRSYL